MEYATVYEAVRLAALTRLPASWSNETKIANVLEIIERLRLSSAIHTLVRDLRAEQVRHTFFFILKEIVKSNFLSIFYRGRD